MLKNKNARGWLFHFFDSLFLSIPVFGDKLTLGFENLVRKLKGSNVRFKTKRNGKYVVIDGGRTRQFAEVTRGLWLYRGGLETRGEQIFLSYCLQNVEFDENDIVIDCGANLGDLFIKLEMKIHPSNYYAFEPNLADFECLVENLNHQANVFNVALAEKSGPLVFYQDTKNADSSAIRPKKNANTVSVAAISLDEFVASHNIRKIKLLKVEAEGYEPEVLKGSLAALKISEYICIDGGYERGDGHDQTFTFIANFLINNGFDMVDIYFKWHRALFRKRNIP